MKCPYCKVEMQSIKGLFGPERIEYEGRRCPKCAEELMSMEQLKELGDKYKIWRKSARITFSKWGNSIGVRVPKEIVTALHIKPGATALVTREKHAIKIVPA